MVARRLPASSTHPTPWLLIFLPANFLATSSPAGRRPWSRENAVEVIDGSTAFTGELDTSYLLASHILAS